MKGISLREIRLLLPVLLFVLGSCSSPKVYTNPVIYADYSDPDLVCVDGEYWMTASSFNCTPGLQILHSTNLVDWEVVSAALPEGIAYQGETSEETQHGNGVWAPSIRYHEGVFYIFWGDPDFGIYQVHTSDPLGEWSEPLCVIPGKGMIDPCPLWDDDGRVWLVHAWAKSRCGFNNKLSVRGLSSDCTSAVSDTVTVFNGFDNGQVTTEGPKFYKRNGEYVILCPSGGVKTGHQLVLKSATVTGKYEMRVAMHSGDVDVFGPHQGGWVTDAAGKDWFLHFEDRYAWGRVVHLQPMSWTADGWCIIGEDIDGDGIGEPVLSHERPTPFRRKAVPVRPELLFQYQGNAPSTVEGSSALDSIPNLWLYPSLKLEKISGPEMEYSDTFTVTREGRQGIIVFGTDYATIEVAVRDGQAVILRKDCLKADKGGVETVVDSILVPVGCTKVTLCVSIKERRNLELPDYDGGDTYSAICSFRYSFDPTAGTSAAVNPATLGPDFIAAPGRWIGAKVGSFHLK